MAGRAEGRAALEAIAGTAREADAYPASFA